MRIAMMDGCGWEDNIFLIATSSRTTHTQFIEMVSTRAKEEFKNGFIKGAQELYHYLRNESESRSFQTELDDLFQSFRQSRPNEWPQSNPNQELQDEDDLISRELDPIQNKRSSSISLSTDPPTPAPSEPETPPPAYARPRLATSKVPTPSPRKKSTKNVKTSTLPQPKPPVSNKSSEPQSNAVAPNATSTSKDDQSSPTTSAGTKRKGIPQQDEDQEDEEPVKAKRPHKSRKKIEQEKEMILDGTLGKMSPPTYRSLQVLL